MDGGTISASAVSSIFTATLRISQVVYELKAVGEQTRDLLDSTNHVETCLEVVRTLRRQKSSHLDPTEKRWIDDVLINTEKTLGNVAALIEPARVDMQTKFGRVGFVNRGLFVFRDSPKVGTNLSRLNLAGQSLNTAMNILCTREGRAITGPGEKSTLPGTDVAQQARNDAQPPPPYVESEFLNRRRNKHLSNRPVTRCSSTTSLGTVKEEQKTAETADRLTTDVEAATAASVVTAQEVIPTPCDAPPENPLDEASGLQLCEATLFQSPSSSNLKTTDGPPLCDAECVSGLNILNFEGADGLEVCGPKYTPSEGTKKNQFDEPDGLQVFTGWDAPIPVLQESSVDVAQMQSGQDQPQQHQREPSQWYEQRSSYQQLPYPLSQDERSVMGRRHDSHLQNPHWQYQHTGDQHRRISQLPNLPYPNPPYPDPTYQSTLNQYPPYPNSPYPNQTAPLRQQTPHQHGVARNDQQWKQPPPSSPPPSLLPMHRGSSASSDSNSRPTSNASYVTNDRPASQATSSPIAYQPVPKPPDAHPLTESPSSIWPSPVPRRTSQSSALSWTPSEISQVSSTTTTSSSTARKSKGRAWLEFQAGC